MADFTQSANTFISHQLLTHPASLEGTPLACATFLEGVITVKVANIETTANATGVGVIIMGSLAASGDDAWFTLKRFTGTTTAAETEALTATEPVAEQTLAMASTTNLAVGDQIYIRDTGTLANSEWNEIIKVTTNTSIQIMYGLANEKDSSDDVFDQAEIFVFSVDCAGLSRVNVYVVHEAATGSNLHVEALGLFATDIE
jgi:hypothetical protein